MADYCRIRTPPRTSAGAESGRSRDASLRETYEQLASLLYPAARHAIANDLLFVRSCEKRGSIQYFYSLQFLIVDSEKKSALHYYNLHVPFWTDKPVRHQSCQANDDGTKHGGPETVNDKAGNQQGSQPEHSAIENQQE